MINKRVKKRLMNYKFTKLNLFKNIEYKFLMNNTNF